MLLYFPNFPLCGCSKCISGSSSFSRLQSLVCRLPANNALSKKICRFLLCEGGGLWTWQLLYFPFHFPLGLYTSSVTRLHHFAFAAGQIWRAVLPPVFGATYSGLWMTHFPYIADSSGCFPLGSVLPCHGLQLWATLRNSFKNPGVEGQLT